MYFSEGFLVSAKRFPYFSLVVAHSPLDVHVRNEAGAGPKRGEHGTVHVAPRPRLDAAAHVGEER